MWTNKQKETDDTVEPVRSASGKRRWDVPHSEPSEAAQTDAQTASSKRRWDQDTPHEPYRKKTEPARLSESDTSTLSAKSWKDPGKISMKINSSDKTVHSSPAVPRVSQEPIKQSGIKIGFSVGAKKEKLTPAPIKMSLGVQRPKEAAVTIPKAKLSATAANAFNDDESDEEEMPPEAKMRMKNIGRETPTAAGPNSFGKGRLGFCDRQKIIQRELERVADDP